MQLLALFGNFGSFRPSARNSRSKSKRAVLGRTMALSTGSLKGYYLVDRELEHIWRELLQKQLGEHWLNLYYPEQPKKEPILPKIRGDGGKAA